MCNYHSAILLPNGDIKHWYSNSHSGIVELYGIPENTDRKTNFVELEWDGKGEYSLDKVVSFRNGLQEKDLSNKQVQAVERYYKLIQRVEEGNISPIKPGGMLHGLEFWDVYVRAVENEAVSEKDKQWIMANLLTQVGENKVVQKAGFGSTQKARNDSTQTAGENSTQTAGENSTQKAGFGSTQTAGDNSTQTARNYSTQTARYGSTQTAGDNSTQKAGDGSTQKAGDGSTQKAGNDSTQTTRNYSTQTARYGSTQTARNCSTQIAGDYSTQTAGNDSTQTVGNGSNQTVGNGSTQIAGKSSTLTAGLDSKQKAGLNSVIIVRWWDGGRWLQKIGLIDGKTLKPDVFYTLKLNRDKTDGKFVKIKN